MCVYAFADDVNNVMMALSDVLGIDAALVIVEKQPALLRWAAFFVIFGSKLIMSESIGCLLSVSS